MAQRTTPLDKLRAVIGFEIFRDRLIELLGYKDRVDKCGNAPFDPVFMFKVVVMQKYYALSEEQTEEQILDRSSFMRFLGVAALFSDLDEALTARGIHGKEGVTVDASFVEVPRQHNGRKTRPS
ncbi:transposase, partial [Luteolibacter pohnpeiensis]|nr:transposase [Luteolibacter pohnpeiensis]